MSGTSKAGPTNAEIQAEAEDALQLDAHRAPLIDVAYFLGGGTLPEGVGQSISGGASISENEFNVVLSTDGTVDEFARLNIHSDLHATAGAWVGWALVGANQAIGDLLHEYSFGFCDRARTGSDVVGFFPTVGDSTAGNVRVDDGGVDNDGSVAYPALDERHGYAVVVDFEDTETRFYLDKDPILGTPDATIAAVPDKLRPWGVRMADDGSDGADNAEQLVANALGLRWYPNGL